MKRNFSLLLIVLVAAVAVSSQVRPPTPRGSQKATVSQTLGTTEVSVTYSRPAIFGRKVYGDWPKPTSGEATLDNGLSAGLSISIPVKKESGTRVALDYAFRATDIYNGIHNIGLRLDL